MKKILVLMRHGQSPAVGQDYKRTLNEEGRKEAEYSALSLKGKNFKPDIVVSSPLTRAVQTANIVAQAFAAKTEVCDELSGAQNEGIIWSAVSSYLGKYNNVLIVGHQPYLSALTGRMLGYAAVSFPTGSFRVVEFENWENQTSSDIAEGKEICKEKNKI